MRFEALCEVHILEADKRLIKAAYRVKIALSEPEHRSAEIASVFEHYGNQIHRNIKR